MTERLYYTDAYRREFEALVTDRAEEGRRVYLDRTAFYPASGGQPFDTGRLGGVRVVDVVDEGERVAHLVEAPVPAGPVSGTIDWPRRFDHMQQHTGQHLLSAVIAERFGHQTASVHFGPETSTLDLDAAALPPDQLAAAEEQANAVAVENRPVTVGFEEAGAAAGLRRASGREGTLRIVTIQDLDRSACGGTHVRATGEIGAILIGKVERVRKIVRLEFLCGMRAVRRARTDLDLLGRLAVAYSSAAEDLPALLEGQRAELRQEAALRRELEAKLAAHRAVELYQSVQPSASGNRIVVVREDSGPVERLRPLAQAVAALPGGIFAGAVGAPPAVLLAAAEGSGVDAAGVLKEALRVAGGRGGGNPRLAQGSVPEPGSLDGAIRALLDKLA